MKMLKMSLAVLATALVASCPSPLESVSVVSVEFNEATYSFVSGSSPSFTCTVLPADAPQAVTYTSSNPNTLVFGANGKAFCLNSGTTTVTVRSAADSSVIDTALVTVTPAVLASGTWYDGELPDWIPGGTFARHCFSFPVISGKYYRVAWNDSMNGDGTKTLDVLSSGYHQDWTGAYFSSESQGYGDNAKTFLATATETFFIQVFPTNIDSRGTFSVCCIEMSDVESVSLDSSAVVLSRGTLQLAASVLPTGANQAMTWTTDASTVATVSSTGVVMGKKPGTATITATSVADPTKSADCTVTVSGNPLVSGVWNPIAVTTGYENWFEIDALTTKCYELSLDDRESSPVTYSGNLVPSAFRADGTTVVISPIYGSMYGANSKFVIPSASE